MPFAYFNNAIVPLEEVTISPYDLGLLRGYAVFDFLRTYKGKPFKLTEHLVRLRKSAAQLMLPIVKTDEEITEAVLEVIRLNAYPESTVRIVLTGGKSMDSRTVLSPTFYILVDRLTPTPSEQIEKGVRVKTIENLRTNPTAKSIDYQVYLKAIQQFNDEGVAEFVYVHQGNVLEGATSNICAFFGSTLVTPKLNVLPGITREVVLEIAAPHWHIEERNLKLSELLSADEVFLTATNKEVMPVTYIDGTIVNTGTPGPRTKKLVELFKEYTKNS
ncbi:MAG: aminotransferase class IV [Patescibacteria group bacterium]